MANGMPWSQRPKLETAGQALSNWETAAKAAGAHIAQINFELDPVVEGQPPTVLIFEWDQVADQYVVRTS